MIEIITTLATKIAINDDYGLLNVAQRANIPTGVPSPAAIAASIINIFLSVVGIIAVLMIIYAGFLWLTSQGNEEKITKAKTLIQNAVIGLFIILASYSITSFIVKNLKQATTTSTATPTYTCGTGGDPKEKCEVKLSCETDLGIILTDKTCVAPAVCCKLP